jgi:hypothetical protein
MLRVLVYGLAVLHLGPGIAFAVLAFGCDPSQPYLGALCEQGSLGAFLGITLVIWLVLGLLAAAHFALGGRAVKMAADSSGDGKGSGAA